MFDEVVDNTVMDGQLKLTMLLQYTCGSEKAAKINCALIGGESGYNQARAILHNRYGNSHMVSHVMDRDGWSGKSIIINTLLPFTHLRLITYKSISTIKYKSYQRDIAKMNAS